MLIFNGYGVLDFCFEMKVVTHPKCWNNCCEYNWLTNSKFSSLCTLHEAAGYTVLSLRVAYQTSNTQLCDLTASSNGTSQAQQMQERMWIQISAMSETREIFTWAELNYLNLASTSPLQKPQWEFTGFALQHFIIKAIWWPSLTGCSDEFWHIWSLFIPLCAALHYFLEVFHPTTA